MSNFDLYQMHNALRAGRPPISIACHVNALLREYVHKLSKTMHTHDKSRRLIFVDPITGVEYDTQICECVGRLCNGDKTAFGYCWKPGHTIDDKPKDISQVDAIKVGTIWIISYGAKLQFRCMTIGGQSGVDPDADPRAVLDMLPLDAIKDHMKSIRPKDGPLGEVHIFPMDFPRGTTIILPRQTIVKYCSHEFLRDETPTIYVPGITDNVMWAVLVTLSVDVYASMPNLYRSNMLDELSADECLTYARTLITLGVKL